MSHGDTVTKLPPGYDVLASTARCRDRRDGQRARPISTARSSTPKSCTREYGRTMLKNFLHGIAGLPSDWEMGSFVDRAIDDIRAQVGSDKVICALSGGVDSAVAATLVARAIGEQLTCVFVDHGLLRKDEGRQVLAAFRDVLHLNVIAVDARERFLSKLAGRRRSRAKAHHHRARVHRVFEEEAAKIPGVKYLVQGTLYPDVIESKTPASKAGHKIKSHHNVGGLPEKMALTLVEPLRTLFKDEVRELGRVLGFARAHRRAPAVPGPGPRRAHHRRHYRGALGDRARRRRDRSRGNRQRRRSSRDPWQYFAVLTPVRSVGVMGDGRTYDHLVAVRAITSEDGMTADWARLPHELLERISTRIVNEVPGVNRVAYDITSKPPSTVEWE